MYCRACGKETNQLLSICNQEAKCIDCCKKYLDTIKKKEYKPQGTTAWLESKPVLYSNKRNNVKACFIKNIPEQYKTAIFIGDTFGFYSEELSQETLDAMEDSNLAVDWSSGITMTKASGSEGVKVENDNLGFGDKNFTITLPKIKPNPETDFYVNIWFECPVCGYKAQSSANSKGEPAPLCPACFKKANIPFMKVKE